MRKVSIKSIYITLAVMLFAGACSKDPRPDDTTGVSASDPTCKLTIILPDLDNATRTRAFSVANENTLQSIDVFAFEVQADGVTETYAYHRSSNSINDNSANTKTFTVSLKQSKISEKYRFVMFANLSAEIAAVEHEFVEGAPKQEILDRIKFTSPSRWNTTSSPLSFLPMWGETANTYTISGSSNGTSLGTIKMFHSLARIDIGLNYNSTDKEFKGLPNFDIKSVLVHNSNDKGAAAPSQAQQANMMSVAEAADAPTIPSGATLNTPEEAYPLTGQFGFMREIYVSEYDNRNELDDDKQFCLLLEGYYTAPGQPKNTTTTSWYRLDLYDASASGTPFQNRYDILRNHLYRINITSVDGPGYENIEDAKKSRAMQMEAEVIPWNMYWSDNQIGSDISLSVSEVDFNLSYHRHLADMYQYYPTNNRFTVTTDNPDGFTVRYTDEAGDDFPTAADQWLRLYPDDETQWTGTVNMQILTDANVHKFDTDPRRARIYITSGKWEYVLYVSQTSVTCGWDNDFLPIQIGDRVEPYNTHAYSNPYNGITLCMMVENLDQVKPEHDDNAYVLKTYPGLQPGEKGYYYNAQRAVEGTEYCPEGWRVPPVYTGPPDLIESSFLFSYEEISNYDGQPVTSYPPRIDVWFNRSKYADAIVHYNYGGGDPDYTTNGFRFSTYPSAHIMNFYAVYPVEPPAYEVQFFIFVRADHTQYQHSTYLATITNVINGVTRTGDHYIPLRCAKEE